LTISAVYIWELRKGVKDNPTKKHMEALASFFGVPSGYFMDDALAARVDKQLELAVAGRDGRLLNLALRASGLSDTSIDTILALIEHTRTLEGLESGDSD
jgi:transcriptional regulator with XRE-family HTH domain